MTAVTHLLRLDVNGSTVDVAAPAHWTLLEVLRYRLALTGSKQGCDKGDCGACTVLFDGKARLACITLAADAVGHRVTTIEGLVTPAGLDVLQRTFDEAGALQCGFCQPGMIVAARACLDRKPDATRAEIKEALASNLCRCTGYTKIFEAVEQAVRAGKAAHVGGPASLLPSGDATPAPASGAAR
ncbi:MAG: (2Fe-2S)-binding protein [Planctomycetes bacterium]|nr:(2Fe-2S)-binding protein [Planctomycetota bacterium]